MRPHPEVLTRNVPVKTRAARRRRGAGRHGLRPVLANYGVDRGLRRRATSRTTYDDDVPYTPAWAEKITGVQRDAIITVAREFALNAEKTKGKSMVILGAGMNHWYHMDMNYRGIINMLVMCGCIGQSGGGWSHYVGQEKLRPQTGWTRARLRARLGPPAAADELDLVLLRPHRPVALRDGDVERDPVAAPRRRATGTASIIDFNVRAERMGWLPSAPQLKTNPLEIGAGRGGRGHGAEGLRRRAAEVAASSKLSCEDPDDAGELAAQPVRLALEPARLLRQGPRVLPEAPARHPARRAGQGSRRGGPGEAEGGRMARGGAAKASSTCW